MAFGIARSTAMEGLRKIWRAFFETLAAELAPVRTDHPDVKAVGRASWWPL